MLYFENDYCEGAHPAILQKLVETNFEKVSGYGTDPYCASAREKIRAACGAPDSDVWFISGGTQSNAIVTAPMLRRWEGVRAASTGHVAAHEAGHAVQYAENYGPVRLRTAIIPATQIGSKFSFILLLVGMVLYSQSLFFVGILLFSLTTIFQLITLPVEFNASHRALQTLENEQLLYDDELPGARKVLKAAALTYVASAAAAILQLLRLILLFGRNNRD